MDKKFRVYHKTKMFYFSLDDIGATLKHSYEWYNPVSVVKGVELSDLLDWDLMESIWIKDKDWKDIYISDRVKAYDTALWSIRFWIIEYDKVTKSYTMWGGSFLSLVGIEVVWNIIENPEWL